MLQRKIDTFLLRATFLEGGATMILLCTYVNMLQL